MREEKFLNWLIEVENKSPTTAKTYSRTIHKLSEHLSSVKPQKIDLYELDNGYLLKQFANLYDLKGKYSEFGNIGHGTYRNAIKAYQRYFSKSPKIHSVHKKIKVNDSNNIDLTEFDFPKDLTIEAEQMADYYKLIYCLEKSIRNLIQTKMRESFGNDWWNLRISTNIQSNVKTKIDKENSGIYSKKSLNKIDYTTFGELRIIVKSNWNLFSDILKNIEDFNKITKDLNVLRNSIAHSVLLPQDEILRLNLALKDWFRLLK
ncbi:hypothetical protein E1J38_013415 [Seonamhaeicola sediminis]|uniref:Swt1-like HEPN domain-containing protein n=1 Tax=Seonamhaeicola sediminis TaxID=2528206 RepID=A0A562YBN8_9FLAO|nr:Swt1 family HEPN domain-containing protein [Seonamhaeicola sediminis]TWO31516.1 hypothetical protein E1J38_013415 [Seonamhaeicola sediminis]